MTTISGVQPGRRYRGVNEVQSSLDGVRNRRWLIGVFSALLAACSVAALGLLLTSLCGYIPDQPPSSLRWSGFAILLLLWICCGGAVVRAILNRHTLAQTARFIETRFPKLRNDLINTVLLAEDPDQPSPLLVQCAIRETLARTRGIDFRRCVSFRPLRNAIGLATLAGGVLLAFALLQPGVFRRGLFVVLQPGAYVPAGNTLPLLTITPQDNEVFPGEPMTIRLSVQADTSETLEAEVVFASQEQPIPMQPGASSDRNPDARTFVLRRDAVHEPFRYFVRAQGAGKHGRWPADRPWYQVRLRSITLTSLEVDYEYPSYTGKKPNDDTLTSDEAALRAPVGTFATLHVSLNTPVGQGVMEFQDGQRNEMNLIEGGRAFQTRVAIRKNSAYRILLFSETGRVLLRLPNGGQEQYFPIRAVPDAPPTISLRRPGRDLTLPAGGMLPMRIEATDDYGLTRVQLWAGKDGQDPAPVDDVPKITPGQSKAKLTFRWNLAGFQDGDDIVYYATATDNRQLGTLGGRQTQATPTFKILIRNPVAVKKERKQQFQELQTLLLDLLRRQTRLRVQTAITQQQSRTVPQVQREGRTVYDGQLRLGNDLQRLSETFPFDAGMDDLRWTLKQLSENEAPLAVEQAQVVMTLTDLAQRNTACPPLLQTQDAILHTMQDMLAMLPVLARSIQDSEQKLGSDLTPEQRRETREALNEALKKFIADQKKVLEAGERLTKKPLDDFTAADEKLLAEQSALQDKWENFLNEAFADFSKLAEQDFANPSLLKELLSVRTDVTMAKDALKKQAVEIATACEDNGIENAESLTANLEKWLPDKPDREKWAMESPEQQDNIEQAELPTELEDLMGELLEEEEDLFEEMDDISSKATMSGDKGIGWDAMDGPISNMNAQGVTGNRLPNTSEIQGRSGEGRTGKSSGEFVEDKAVGKGGRRTPTRLGSDPFQAGQIKDTSTDPAGGATGGGKRSGAGAEGLEGPTPAATSEPMKRLSGRQASLVNRAERIAAQLQLGDFTSFRMQQAVLLMNRVRRDLQDGEYQNALRRRNATLRAIRQTRSMLQDRIDVTQDTSKAVAEQKLENLTDRREAPLPEEFRQPLRNYYQRVSETSTK